MKKSKLILSIIIFIGCSAKISYYLPSNSSRVHTGLEVFIDKYAHSYKGKKAIVVTNHSGVNFYLRNNIRLFRDKNIQIIMIIAPEHGLYGYQNRYGRSIYNIDRTYKLRVYNLHNLSVKYIRQLLDKSDFVVFDIQDMGMRCYTYLSNLKSIMDALKGSDKKLLVLDRPNPIGFLRIDGALLEKKFSSYFISSFPSPFIYNMTIGEAALYYKAEFIKKINLEVIEMENYNREMFFHETCQPWVPPSPNLPTYNSAIIYSAVVLMEGINLSLGRGTPKPFEYIGAPWIEPNKFCRGLNKLELENFKFRPVYFKPTFSKYRGIRCGGAQIFYVGGRFRPSEVSFKIIKFLMKNYRHFRWEKSGRRYDVDLLTGTDKFRKKIIHDKAYIDFKNFIDKDIEIFKKVRKKYLLY